MDNVLVVGSFLIIGIGLLYGGMVVKINYDHRKSMNKMESFGKKKEPKFKGRIG